MRTSALIVTACTLVFLGGCASRQPLSSTEGTTLVRNGTVIEVRDVAVRGGSSSGIGSAVGAILGGIAGSAIGGGNGSTVAGIGGAVAGGVAGQHAAQSATTNTTQVKVRLQDGEEHVYNAQPGESFKVGDAVRMTTTHAGTKLSHY